MNLFKKNYLLAVLILIVFCFYYPVFTKGLLPIPSDTIVGMYHPFRDKIWDNLTSGVPFKNPLITDPVRQQFVWRKQALDNIKNGQLPVWNPYSFSGTFLLANFQSAAFYPLNLLYFLFPDHVAWTFGIIFSHLATATFLFFFLRNLGLRDLSALTGSLAFSFSGFVISWLTWNTIVHIAAWTILSLLSVDKIIVSVNESTKKNRLWYSIFTLSQIFSFFAGHLQIFFYGELLVCSYIIFRLIAVKKSGLKLTFNILFCLFLVSIVILPQLISTIDFIKESARELDQGQWAKSGWFIPFQNLAQFLAPDYFGNPATGNYIGIWNYAEFVGYVGLFPLLIALYSILFVRSKVNNYFISVLTVSLIFAFPTLIAKIPFLFNLPLISTSQPTRLIFLVDFSLAVLAATGFDYFLSSKNKNKILITVLVFAGFFIYLYLFSANPVSRRNLLLPLAVFLLVSFLILLTVQKKIRLNLKAENLIFAFIILLTSFELTRFGWKFTPFTRKDWLFPKTEVLSYLTGDISQFRIMSLDRRIMPPNFSVYFKLQDVSGYDPLYFRSYGSLVSSWNSGTPQYSPGSFNRIVTPDNWNSIITDLLNVKYILSMTPIYSESLNLLLKEGDTHLYYNRRFFPKVWLVGKLVKVENRNQELEKLFDNKINFRDIAVTSEIIDIGLPDSDLIAKGEDFINIEKWSENSISIKTKSEKNKLLVLSEIFSDNWTVKIDGVRGKIYRVNYLLRGIPLNRGVHKIEFTAKLI